MNNFKPSYIKVKYPRSLIKLDTEEKTFEFINSIYAQRSRKYVAEYAIFLYLAENDRLITWEVHSMGAITATIVDTLRVAAVCTITKAAKVIFIHNHPSGSPKASNSDIQLGKKIYNFLNEIKVELKDILIHTDEGNASFVYDAMFSEPKIKYKSNNSIHILFDSLKKFGKTRVPKPLMYAFKPNIYNFQFRDADYLIDFAKKRLSKKSFNVICANHQFKIIGIIKFKTKEELLNLNKFIRKVTPTMATNIFIASPNSLKYIPTDFKNTLKNAGLNVYDHVFATNNKDGWISSMF